MTTHDDLRAKALAHTERQWLRRLLGLPRKRCESLAYTGGGKVRACIACLVASPQFKRQLAAFAAIDRAAQSAEGEKG